MRPGGPGWGPIARKAGGPPPEADRRPGRGLGCRVDSDLTRCCSESDLRGARLDLRRLSSRFAVAAVATIVILTTRRRLAQIHLAVAPASRTHCYQKASYYGGRGPGCTRILRIVRGSIGLLESTGPRTSARGTRIQAAARPSPRPRCPPDRANGRRRRHVRRADRDPRRRRRAPAPAPAG